MTRLYKQNNYIAYFFMFLYNAEESETIVNGCRFFALFPHKTITIFW